MDVSRLPTELADRFEIQRVLGKGSMGAVYAVKDRRLGREVALKRMIVEAGPVGSSRFLREARALARLEHPGIVRIHDVIQAGDELFLVTEILEGSPMNRLPDGTDPLAPMLDVAEAVEAVHEAGLLHRDIKPANLFFTREGRGVILDFGLAFVGDHTRLTATGLLVGTPAYLAPELLRGGHPTPASDWYSWGVSLYQLYEGDVPHGVQDIKAMLEGREFSRSEVGFRALHPGHAARPLVEAALDPDPDQRPRSRRELESLLARAARRSSRRRPRGATSPAAPPPRGAARHGRGRILGGVVAVGLVAAGITATLRRAAPPAAATASPSQEGPPPIGAEVQRVLDGLEGELDRGLGLGPHPDPLAWLDVADTRAGIQVAYHYLARNPEPRSLSQAERQAMGDIDGRLVSAGGPELFGPLLDLAEYPADFEVSSADPYIPDDLKGTRLVGPAAIVGHTYLQVLERFRELERGLRETDFLHGKGPEGMPSALVPITLLGESGLRHLLETSTADPEHRRAAEIWTYPASRRIRTLLLAGARLHLAGPATTALDALPRTTTGNVRALLLTGVAALPIEVLVPGQPRTIGAWSLRELVLRSQARARRYARRTWKPLVSARLHALTRAAELALGQEPRASRLPRGNLQGRVECLLLLDREDQARELVASHLDFLVRWGHTWEFADVVVLLTQSWIRDRRAPETRRVVQAVLDRFERVTTRLSSRSYRKLRAATQELREAFPASSPPGG